MALSIGQVRTPAVSYLGQDLAPLWTTNFHTWQDMLGFFHGDLPAARLRADSLDARVTNDATARGGAGYAGLCSLALRQAYGGTELVVGSVGRPWAFFKEISSDGNVSSVDVVFPASPAWLCADPAYLRKVPSTAAASATAYYKILKQWADYLVAHLPDPGYQNQTDDFAGFIAHSVNLQAP